MDPPTYLSSLQNNTRARPIPWEGAVRAGTITDQDLKKIKAVDKVRKEQRRKIVEENIPTYRSLLLGGGGQKSVLEAAAKRQDVVQYILVLTGDLIQDVPGFAAQLVDHADPFRPFLPFVGNSQKSPEDTVSMLASNVLASLVAAAPPTSTNGIDEALHKLYKHLSTLTRSSDSGMQDLAIQTYSTVLTTTKARQLFWDDRKDTLTPLVDILRTALKSDGIGIQLLYHALLAVWQLSFAGASIGEQLNQEVELISLYTALLRISPKEKTTRLILSTLLNLITPNQSTLLPYAVSARLPAILDTLKGRHLSDPDLVEDLNALSDMLTEYTSSQTTFDEYSYEVMAGHLRWSPPHRSPTFWSENAAKILTDNKSELPKKLAEILAKPWDNDKQVLAIACNDIGWLVKQCPEKKELLEKLGIKARVMELMAEADEGVRWESLRAVGEWLRYSIEDRK